MIRVAIVEDDAASRDRLRHYLRQYESEQGESFEISAFSDGQEIAYH